MNFIQYLILSSICLSISYLAFRLIFIREFRFKQQRVFLLVSLALSLILPLTGFRIDIAFFGRNTESVMILNPLNADDIQMHVSTVEPGFFTMYTSLLMGIYAIISAIIITIITIQFLKILWLYRISIKTRHDKGIILSNDTVKSPFSFFRWIFIPEEIDGKEERESIIIHEGIHVSQYHSFDNLLIELVAALTWFNPLVWMVKKSLHLVHEYLADEGTIGAGIDSLRYRALLINQVSEERLICLSSSFNNSLLKKRMIMMTKSKNNHPNKNRILALLPLSVILFLTTAFLNGLFPEETKGSPATIANFGQAGFEKVAGNLTQDTVKNAKVSPAGTKKKRNDKDAEVKVDLPVDLNEGIDPDIKIDATVDLNEDIDPDVNIDKSVDLNEEIDTVITIDEVVDLKDDIESDVKVDKIVVLKNTRNGDVKAVKIVDPQEKTGVVKLRKQGQGDIKVIGYGDSGADTVIYIVDGVHVKKIKDISPDDIESVNVLKDDNVIVIRTRKNAEKKAANGSPAVRLKGAGDDLIYVIDGNQVDKNVFESLEPDQIESVSVLKGGYPGIKKYTDRADVDGVIVVTTKK